MHRAYQFILIQRENMDMMSGYDTIYIFNLLSDDVTVNSRRRGLEQDGGRGFNQPTGKVHAQQGDAHSQCWVDVLYGDRRNFPDKQRYKGDANVADSI
jgi:hypothetical protein